MTTSVVPYVTWAAARDAGNLVRIENTRPGDRVLTAYNGVQTIAKKATWPSYGVRTEEGLAFAGCADVLVLEDDES